MTNEFANMSDEEFASYVADGRWMMRSDHVHIYIKKELLRRLAASQPGEPPSPNKIADMIRAFAVHKCGDPATRQWTDDSVIEFVQWANQFFRPSVPSPQPKCPKCGALTVTLVYDPQGKSYGFCHTEECGNIEPTDFPIARFFGVAPSGSAGPQQITPELIAEMAAHIVWHICELESDVYTDRAEEYLKKTLWLDPPAEPSPEATGPQSQVDPTVHTETATGSELRDTKRGIEGVASQDVAPSFGLSNLPPEQMKARSVTINGFPAAPAMVSASPYKTGCETCNHPAGYHCGGDNYEECTVKDCACKTYKRAAAQPVAADQTKVEEIAEKIEQEYGNCCGDMLNISAADLAIELKKYLGSNGYFLTDKEFAGFRNAILRSFFPVSRTPTEILEDLMLELHYTLDIGGKLSLGVQTKMKKADEYLNSLVPKSTVAPVSGNGQEPPEIIVRCHCCKGTQMWERNEDGEVEVYHDCASGLHAAKERIKELEAGAASHNGQGWARVDHAIDVVVARIAREHGLKLPDASLIEFGTAVYKEAVRGENME